MENTSEELCTSPTENSDKEDKLSNIETECVSPLMTDGKSSDSYDSGLADDKNEKNSSESLNELFHKKENFHSDESEKQLNSVENNEIKIDKITIEEVDLLDDEMETNPPSAESTDDSSNFIKICEKNDLSNGIESKKNKLITSNLPTG